MKFYHKSSIIQLHFIVIILGFTGILGKLITLPATQLVLYRMLVAFIFLFIFLKFKKTNIKLPVKSMIFLIIIGTIVSLHWICFFYAIKVSNVSVTLGCLSTTTLFTSIIEPLTHNRKIKMYEVILGFIIIIGLYIIFRFEIRYIEGIVFSVIAALLASIFSVLNKKITDRFDNDVISFYEMVSGFIIILIYSVLFNLNDFFNINFKTSDIIYILILGSICTAYAFSATVKIMKKLTAYVVVLAINLEPIYGILLAFFIFGESEKMTPGFYIGAIIILLSVFLYPYVAKKYDKRIE